MKQLLLVAKHDGRICVFEDTSIARELAEATHHRHTYDWRVGGGVVSVWVPMAGCGGADRAKEHIDEWVGAGRFNVAANV